MSSVAAVTFLDVRRRFQFPSVEIGGWVTEPEKQRSAGQFYSALSDLMANLCGTESLISLRSTLALYPEGEERARINAAFQRYFASLGQALRRSQGA